MIDKTTSPQKWASARVLINASIDESNKSIIETKLGRGISLPSGDVYYRYNGIDSVTNLSQTYRLENDGDHIEMVVRLKGYGNHIGKGIAGKSPYNYNTMGFASQTSFWIRNNTGAGTYFDTPYQNGQFVKFKLAIEATDWVLYINNVESDRAPYTDYIDIDNFGDGYYFTSVDIKSATINNTAINISNESSLNVEKLQQFSKDLDNCNVIVQVTANTNVMVFKRLYDNEYIGFNIAYLLNVGVRLDYWRISGADVYTLKDSIFYKKGANILQDAETEFTYATSTPNHTYVGGYHNYEEVINKLFTLDGIEIDTSITATYYGNVFVYTQESTIMSPLDQSDEVKHHKIVEISDKWIIKNNIELLADLVFSNLYGTLLTLSNDITSQLTAHDLGITLPGSTDGSNMGGACRHFSSFGHGIGVDIKILTNDITSSGVQFDDNYNKPRVSSAFDGKIGDKREFSCEVVFSKLIE